MAKEKNSELKVQLDAANKKQVLTDLALYDLLFDNADIVVRVRDSYNDLHKIYFSRMLTNGIVLDVNRGKGKDFTVYDLIEIEHGDKYQYLPVYLKEALGQAFAKRREMMTVAVGKTTA